MAEKYFKPILLSILSVVFIIVVLRPIHFFPDSQGYLQMEIYRSAGYPIFLWLLKQISGNHLGPVTVLTQISIGLIAIYIFITHLKKHLKIHAIWVLFLTIIIATPYVYNHNIANNYLSEALSYPLYLIVALCYILGLIRHSKTHLWIGLSLLFLLIQTRSQFMFLVPIGLLIILWAAYKTNSFKSHGLLFLVCLIFPLFTFLTDKTYHKIVHHHFESTPWTGIHVISPAFYVANENDSILFDNPNERQFFNAIFTELRQKKLNIHHLELSGEDDETSYYIKNFTNIANHTVFDDGRTLMKDGLSKEENYIAIDQLTKKMTLPLVIDNLVAYSKLYIKNFINAFGNSRYALLYLMLLVFSCIGMFRLNTTAFKILSLTTLMTIANIGLVAIGMYTIKRFTFYNDWVIFLALFILMDSFLKNQLKDRI
ncbi:hypothetical protein [Sediminibacter sp. Hel_I_10]|uniref:hypothetical protein n=1 Tax=Sediminibacter sp. Hel_I_10 TaxID=1392490 RepID=UPI00047A551C|nr:hypothetical protein [Sediminibacter sp. Hel_I_10]